MNGCRKGRVHTECRCRVGRLPGCVTQIAPSTVTTVKYGPLRCSHGSETHGVGGKCRPTKGVHRGRLPSINVAPEGNLSRYLQDIRKFPMLTAEEELALSRRWRDNEDIEAAHKLVTSHLRLVAKIAMGYRGYGLPVGELISEGNVGMMQAVKRFDPDRGFRLATYAMWWIRAAIQEYILHSWSLVKMGTTAAQKKLFFNLRRLKGQMQAIDEGDLQPEQVAKIARMLDVPEQDVVSMNRRLAAPDHSLNAPVRQDSEGEWQDWLVDDAREPGDDARRSARSSPAAAPCSAAR